MRWRSFSDLGPGELRGWLVLHWLWLGPCVAVCLLFVGPMVACTWAEQQKRRLLGPSAKWRVWFAWFPVVINEPVDWPRNTVWLEWIERREGEYSSSTRYRIAPASDPAQREGEAL